ncbi:hypothetical protein FM106_07680 [Brachybacterium faecium]|nr:hypothetical protein FM106_07680 [Brachybacterium faecium]
MDILICFIVFIKKSLLSYLYIHPQFLCHLLPLSEIVH